MSDVNALFDFLGQEDRDELGSSEAKNSLCNIVELSPEHVLNIDKSLKDFKVNHGESDLYFDEISAETFPLPELHGLIGAIKNNIYNGTGLSVLRGLPQASYSLEDSFAVFLGIARHVGDKLGMQNKAGDMVSHITDANSWDVPREQRHGIHTNASLPFHTDIGCDILALQVRQRACIGGHTQFASGRDICRRLAKDKPDVLKMLASPIWPLQTSGRDAQHILVPLVHFHNGHIMVNIDPGRLGYQRSFGAETCDQTPNVPFLTPVQQEALATVSEYASKDGCTFEAQAGDIVLVNNWSLLHAREPYLDSGDFHRHFVRLWLHDGKLGWAIPDAVRLPWETAFEYGQDEENPGHSKFPAGSNDHHRLVKRRYEVTPSQKYRKPRYTAGSAAFVIEDSDTEA